MQLAEVVCLLCVTESPESVSQVKLSDPCDGVSHEELRMELRYRLFGSR